MTIFYFVILTLIPVTALLFYFYLSFSREVKEEFSKTYTTVTNGIDKNLDIYFGQVKSLSLQIFSSQEIQSILTKEYNIKNAQADTVRFKSEMGDIYNYRNDVDAVKVFDQDGNSYITDRNYIRDETPSDEDTIRKLKDSTGSFTIIGLRSSAKTATNVKTVFTVGRSLKNLDTGEIVGYLLIDLNYTHFMQVIGLPQDGSSGNILIADSAGSVIYNSQKPSEVGRNYQDTSLYESLGKKERDGILKIKSNYFDWNYLVFPDNQFIVRRLDLVLKTYLVIGILSAAVLTALAYFVARKISGPLERLEQAMGRAEKNNFNEIVPANDSLEEVNQLTRHFNAMLVEIQRHIDRENELGRKRNESEFKALQMQITPHFLYNSLESINCMAQIHGEDEISAMIRSLAKIFQYNMRYDSRTVTFGDEINHVKNYCMLQAVNYQDRFRIEYHIEDRFLDRRVVKFMLQPLVENAIYHGVKQRKSGGLISLNAWDEGSRFMISITDNGKGMTQEEQDHLNAYLKKGSNDLYMMEKDAPHIGLINVNLRLKLTYGESAGIEVKSEYLKGTAVEIMIPLEGAENAEDSDR
jgi:two-component system sensor histidine kinase YesM